MSQAENTSQPLAVGLLTPEPTGQSAASKNPFRNRILQAQNTGQSSSGTTEPVSVIEPAPSPAGNPDDLNGRTESKDKQRPTNPFLDGDTVEGEMRATPLSIPVSASLLAVETTPSKEASSMATPTFTPTSAHTPSLVVGALNSSSSSLPLSPSPSIQPPPSLSRLYEPPTGPPPPSRTNSTLTQNTTAPPLPARRHPLAPAIAPTQRSRTPEPVRSTQSDSINDLLTEELPPAYTPGPNTRQGEQSVEFGPIRPFSDAVPRVRPSRLTPQPTGYRAGGRDGYGYPGDGGDGGYISLGDLLIQLISGASSSRSRYYPGRGNGPYSRTRGSYGSGYGSGFRNGYPQPQPTPVQTPVVNPYPPPPRVPTPRNPSGFGTSIIPNYSGGGPSPNIQTPSSFDNPRIRERNMTTSPSPSRPPVSTNSPVRRPPNRSRSNSEPNTPRLESFESRPVGGPNREVNDRRPTVRPVPGRPLLRDGKVLVYPLGYECSKCHNKGYKPLGYSFFSKHQTSTAHGTPPGDPSHPCRKCWDKYSKLYEGTLTNQDDWNKNATGEGETNYQRPIAEVGQEEELFGRIRHRRGGSDGEAGPSSVSQSFTGGIGGSSSSNGGGNASTSSRGIFSYPGSHPTSRPPAQPLTSTPTGSGSSRMNNFQFVRNPPRGATVVPPGDPRIGGRLCWKCGGSGRISLFIFDSEVCNQCGGVGRLR